MGVVALFLTKTHAFAQQSRAEARVYFFGNSLVTHVSGTDQTAVPHWLAQMALANDRRFAADGQFGFLRNFAADLPPLATWGFGRVQRAWRRGAQNFADAGFDAVMITPANFIQDVPPQTEYRDGSGQSPLGETLKIVDWVVEQDPSIRIFIYAGWPEMANITRAFPPDASGMLQYHRVARGQDLEWYQSYVAALQSARPDADIRLLPVGAQLSRALMTEPFNQIEPLDLYEDDAPHGTPSLYAMAAIVTYAALYDSAPRANMAWPDSLHPILRENMAALIDILADGSLQATLPQPTEAQARPEPAQSPRAPDTRAARQSTPDPTPTRTADLQIEAPAPRVQLDLSGPAGTGLANPALAMGLNGVDDWTAQQPFLDLMKTARPWVGHTDTQWGAVSFEEMLAAGDLDAQGWPKRMPEGATRIETFVLTDMAEEATALEGRYVLRYAGQGKIEVTSRARRPRYATGEITFDYRPGEGLVGITLSQIDPNDPIRDITIVREDRLALHAAGALFNPDWLRVVEDIRAVRFMDWMRTNASPVETWDDRARLSDFTWGWRGVPLEVAVTLANQIGADPWFTLPHQADDAYIAAFATQVRDELDQRLVAHVEYSNELWNFAFPQTQWAVQQAAARWGPGQPDDAWIQFAGARTAEMAEIWEAVYGPTYDAQVKVVMAVHTGWQGLEQAQMQAPLWRAEVADRKPPLAFVDAYAVTGYFGFDFGTEAFAPTVDSWIADSIAAATAQGEAAGKRRVALREYVKTRQFDQAIAPATAALRDGALKTLITEIWPYHAKVASDAGLELIMYEGGTHVVGHAGRTNDDQLTAFFTQFNYTPEMARLYDTALAGWVAAGGTLFNAFVDVATPTKWGSWGALRHLSDDNPRWRALDRFNRTAQPVFEARADGVFLQGITRQGTAQNDVLEGTVEEDILIAGPGDDLMIGHGRADIFHGGPGQDTVRLPGTRAMYSFANAGGRVMATGPHGVATLVEIEVIEFSGGARAAIADLL